MVHTLTTRAFRLRVYRPLKRRRLRTVLQPLFLSTQTPPTQPLNSRVAAPPRNLTLQVHSLPTALSMRSTDFMFIPRPRRRQLARRHSLVDRSSMLPFECPPGRLPPHIPTILWGYLSGFYNWRALLSSLGSVVSSSTFTFSCCKGLLVTPTGDLSQNSCFSHFTGPSKSALHFLPLFHHKRLQLHRFP